ncbi:MAG TPA: 1,4-beta-xylanase [Terriglobales bacterium]|nr:1,4-beta-xylanase [Terriglobales bacterium]
MRKNNVKVLISSLFLLLPLFTAAQASPQRWTEQKARDWYQQQPWLVGSNYIPADAINQLEMWQSNTFDPQQIDKELGWAESLGMNTMRVFLHDLLWQQDAPGFQKRIDEFLTICARHHIRPIFVLFDSVWDPNPKLGPQHPPIPGIHNSGWVQSPGAAALEDPSQYPRLKAYVQGVVGAFGQDPRVLAWDLWNEPNNINDPVYLDNEPKNKRELVLKLLPQVFAWARDENPIQPLTSGVWEGDWSLEKLRPIQRVQLENSDVISFHNYGWPEQFEKRVQDLVPYHRPILCTEYMARSVGSTFDTILPLAKKLHVAAINWGFVAGKTQTYYPWDSWERPYVLQPPAVWFHDIFHRDGMPYRQREVEIIRELTGKVPPNR